MERVYGLGGTSVGAYQLWDCLGHGSCTAVYRADTGSEQCVVKLVDSRLEQHGELAERLRHDAAVLDKIGHGGILPIRDAIRTEGMTMAAMPHMAATTLHDLMVRGELDSERAWEILNQIAESLHLVHERGLVYRVLKPVNVLVDGAGRAYLAEFGITGREIGQLALGTPDFRVAAPQYLAPEQVEAGGIDHRVDIYALGVLAFELATGTPLYGSAAPADILTATLNAGPPSASARNPSLPAEVDAVFRRALARDPSDRHQSAWDLLEELVSPPEVAPPRAPAPTPALPVLTVVPNLDLQSIESERQDVLDSYFATCVRTARQVAGQRWATMLANADLREYLFEDPVEEGKYVPALLPLSRLSDAFDAVFGQDAPRCLAAWGGLVSRRWLESIQPRPPWIAGPPTGRLVDVLSIYVEALDRVRGEELHGWKQVNKQLFRVAHVLNMTAVGRRRQTEACHFWNGAYEAALRWAGLAEDWLVAEVECGCVTGSYDCVFTIVRVNR
jgi:hypothetical protein